MKKLFLLAIVVFALCGCTKNQLVGTWQFNTSEEDDRYSVAMGGIQTFTYEANGDYHSIVEIQAKLGEKSTSVSMEIMGTWEMIDDTHFKVKTTKAILSGKEMENVTEETHTILALDDKTLETMSQGKKKVYKRIK